MPSDLWSFTLEFYAWPGVEQACLDLQASGGNVCLLLFAVWLDKRGAAWQHTREQEILAMAVPWDTAVVRPLRKLRTQWRAAAADDVPLGEMREALKKLELRAEQELLLRLEQLAYGWPKEIVPGEHRWLTALAGQAADLNRDALSTLRATADQT